MHLVITGSSSGIGRVLAVRLLNQGHHVWGLARSEQSAAVAASGTFRASRCDVADWNQVARVAREVYGDWPHLDALVCCAGLLGAVGPATSLDQSHWSATVRANLEGTYHAIRAFHDLLVRAPRRAKIICFSGGGATRARPRFSAYGAAKAAIVRLVETIAEEGRGTALDINAVAPGPIHTRMTDEIVAFGPAVTGQAEHEAALKQKTADGSAMTRALDLVEWLLSPASDGISGRLISAQWDPWPQLDRHKDELGAGDIYTLRRIVPGDRGKQWDAS
ncbi:MAG: hypothetical protein A3G75_08805 [Verrucomicrobia bacterium RIFCSPLOWO2_12_FULL_64_8]|nr:MAG: hypothetical protein A3G75_08805 [Verrucomicrobia bacterium RIFCSPLOWO2_12_FULL_64_8]